MITVFPSAIWVNKLMKHINTDEQYAEIAKNWEGDILFVIQPEGPLINQLDVYMDLWHGKCRQAKIVAPGEIQAKFTLTAPFYNFSKVVLGELDPMQALLTRRLKVKGNLGYMMRNVPVVLDFVRCVQDVTDSVLGQE